VKSEFEKEVSMPSVRGTRTGESEEAKQGKEKTSGQRTFRTAYRECQRRRKEKAGEGTGERDNLRGFEKTPSES
jgi:hypothetical protein